MVTIVDDETPRLQFATATYTVAEATGSVTLTVQRLGPTTTQNTVQYALAGVTATGGGVDFDSTGGTLTFGPGIASRTIVVPIVERHDQRAGGDVHGDARLIRPAAPSSARRPWPR